MPESDKIIEILKTKIKNLEMSPEIGEEGVITEVKDGIAKIFGLKSAKYYEMLEFANNIKGLALNLEDEYIGAVILGDYEKLKAGDQVRCTGKVLSVPVGDNLLGRVINPLGEALDSKGEIKSEKSSPIEKIAPGVIAREAVTVPLQTGIKAVDSMIPIGRGQRELIIGDRGTGKTAIAIDAILNQKDTDVVCIYVAIGQKESKIAKTRALLEEKDALKHTIFVVAGASDPAPLNFIAPYAGCAIGEYFMSQGRDALIVYDDLSKHAWAYREISLLLRRPPGREAFPGDVFNLHSRLLERAARLNSDHGGGSLTALPIIETQAGDISAYIPTNVISITDGQIYLENDLFYQGIRPAINVGLSVSRVGGKAQIKTMKKVAGQLRLDLAQYRELESFAKFSSDLDPATKAKIERGKRLTEILKQNNNNPMAVAEQVAILYAASSGALDEISVDKIKDFEKTFLQNLQKQNSKLLTAILESKEMDTKITTELDKIIEQNKSAYTDGNNQRDQKKS